MVHGHGQHEGASKASERPDLHARYRTANQQLQAAAGQHLVCLCVQPIVSTPGNERID